MVNLGIDSEYYVSRMTKLELNSAFTGEKYRWVLHSAEKGDSLLSETGRLLFIAGDEGRYDISFDIIDANTPYHLSLIHI